LSIGDHEQDPPRSPVFFGNAKIPGIFGNAKIPGIFGNAGDLYLGLIIL
jgi:hypothetical protein